MVSSHLLVISVSTASDFQFSSSFRPGSPRANGPSSKLSTPSPPRQLSPNVEIPWWPPGLPRQPWSSTASVPASSFLPGPLQTEAPYFKVLSTASDFWATRPPPDALGSILWPPPNSTKAPNPLLPATTATDVPGLGPLPGLLTASFEPGSILCSDVSDLWLRPDHLQPPPPPPRPSSDEGSMLSIPSSSQTLAPKPSLSPFTATPSLSCMHAFMTCTKLR